MTFSKIDGPVDPERNTRVYIGHLPRDGTNKQEVEDLLQGYGKIIDMRLMSGFGFLEFEDPRDASDVVKDFNGRDFMGERLVVELSRGGRRGFDGNERESYRERPRNPRPKRSRFRLLATELAPDTTWQDLKDIVRTTGVEPQYTQVTASQSGDGAEAFVEVEREEDLDIVVEQLNGKAEIKGQLLQLKPEISSPQERSRSRSPGYRRGGPPSARRGSRYDAPGRDPGRFDDRGRGPPPTRPRNDDDNYYKPRRSPPRDRDRRDDYGRAPRRGYEDDRYEPAGRDYDEPPRRRRDDDRPRAPRSPRYAREYR